jgi:hypothetical protein
LPGIGKSGWVASMPESMAAMVTPAPVMPSWSWTMCPPVISPAS